MQPIDPYTMQGRLCDDDGMVRRGSMHKGTDFVCTGSAHPQLGVHIRCTNPIHVRQFDPYPGPWYPATMAGAPALRDRIQTDGPIRLGGTAQPIAAGSARRS